MPGTEKSFSQTNKALLNLRELILSGELAPGDRISELAVVERLGVSRTPIRMALVRLEEEGLLEAIPTGGYAVKSFSERDIYAAIEIRGALEGLAARLAAEQPVRGAALLELKNCLRQLDEVVDRLIATAEEFPEYVKLNADFHALVVELADSPILVRQIARAVRLPFASASAFVAVQARLAEARTMFTVAQDQHHCVVRAIEAGEGARAEAIMREHARLAHRNLELALRNQDTTRLVPGSALLQRRLSETSAI